MSFVGTSAGMQLITIQHEQAREVGIYTWLYGAEIMASLSCSYSSQASTSKPSNTLPSSRFALSGESKNLQSACQREDVRPCAKLSLIALPDP
jgi:hypothetical protein